LGGGIFNYTVTQHQMPKFLFSQSFGASIVPWGIRENAVASGTLDNYFTKDQKIKLHYVSP
jgi:hypothetical protein